MSTDSISYAVKREWKPEAPRSTVIPHSFPSLSGRPIRSQSSSTYTLHPSSRLSPDPSAPPRRLSPILLLHHQGEEGKEGADRLLSGQEFPRRTTIRTSSVRWGLFRHRETDVERKQHGCLDEGTEPMVTEYQESTFVKEVDIEMERMESWRHI